MVVTPVTTDLPAAPDDLLKVIHCKCRLLEPGRTCLHQTCTCRKHGLPCVSACKHCNGEACENLNTQDLEEDEICQEDVANVHNEIVQTADYDYSEHQREALVQLNFDDSFIDEEIVESNY